MPSTYCKVWSSSSLLALALMMLYVRVGGTSCMNIGAEELLKTGKSDLPLHNA